MHSFDFFLNNLNIFFFSVHSSSKSSSTNFLVEPIVINLNDAASINTANKYDYLFNLLAKLKFIKNPVDPTESPSSSSSGGNVGVWTWDYKSPKHYKLLKLKLKLLTQIVHLSKLYTMNLSSSSSSSGSTIISTIITGSSSSSGGVSQCKHCLSSLKDKRIVELKNATIHRLTEYAHANLVELDEIFERYMHVRLKNSFDINNLVDLNSYVNHTFMRYGYDATTNLNNDESSSNNSNSSESLKRVEQCSLKIHILLDLLVSDNSISKIFKHETPTTTTGAASDVINGNGFASSSLAASSCLENSVSL